MVKLILLTGNLSTGFSLYLANEIFQLSTGEYFVKRGPYYEDTYLCGELFV
mgnify:CR=1 FL=1